MSEGRHPIDNALAILRHELESMQQQDKVLYKQLLLLRDNVKDLKTELRRERDECEEAMRNLHETSSSDGEAGRHDKTLVIKRGENPNQKHERQDSGISVRHSSEIVTSRDNIGSGVTFGDNMMGTSEIPGKISPVPVHHKKQDSGISVRNGGEMVASRDNIATSGIPAKASPVHHKKQDSGISVRNGGETVSPGGNVTKTGLVNLHKKQDSGISVRNGGETVSPGGNVAKTGLVNLHKKQDSGILIDEEMLNDTKILSRLVFESKTSRGLVKRPDYLHVGGSTPSRVDHNNNHVDYVKQTRSQHYANKDFIANPVVNHARTRSCPAVAPKPVGYHSSVARAHQTQRSVSVVDLSKVTEENVTSTQRKPTPAKSEPRLSIHDKPLQAVFVSAGEVERPKTSPERPQSSPEHERPKTSPERPPYQERPETSPDRERPKTLHERPSSQGYSPVHRSQTMVAVRSNNNLQQNRIYNNSGRVVRSTISPSPSMQSFKNPRRSRIPSDQGVIHVVRQRRNTMSTCHAPSKSWDGSIDETGGVRIIPNLYRSASQISLV